ncbi:MAG: flippase [Candidatus Levyibacteriota bacterium]
MKKLLKLFKIRNNTGTVFRNTFYLTISEFFLKFLGVAWIVYLAHSVTVGDYGIYNYVTATIAIFSFLPDFGVGLIVIREIAHEPKKAPEFLGNSFFLNGFLALITLVVIIIFSLVSGVSPFVFYLIGIAAGTLFLSTLRSVAIFYFDGREKMHYSAILNSLNSFLLVLFASAGVFLHFGLLGVFYGMFFATIFSLGISWAVLLKYIRPVFSYNRKTLVYYLKQGTPLGLAAFAALIYTHIDVLVLAKLLDNRSVGIYSSATPFAFALVQLLNVPFVVAVYPALVRIEKEGKERLKTGILKSLGFIALWSIPAALLIYFLAPVLIPLIFGSKYNAGISILRILIFMVPFMSFSALLYKVLVIIKKQKYYLYISILGAVISFIFNVIFITLLGVAGAGVAAVLTQFLLFLMYVITVYFSVK